MNLFILFFQFFFLFNGTLSFVGNSMSKPSFDPAVKLLNPQIENNEEGGDMNIVLQLQFKLTTISQSSTLATIPRLLLRLFICTHLFVFFL